MFLINFTKQIMKSRLAQILVLTHFVIVILVFLLKPYQEGGGMAYKFFDEPLYYRILFYLDLPSILLIGLIFSPMGTIKFNSIAFYLFSFAFLIIASVQWLLIGYCIERVIKKIVGKNLK